MRDELFSAEEGSQDGNTPKGCLGCAGLTAALLFACFAYGAFWSWRHEQRVAESKRYFLEKGRKVGKIVRNLMAPTVTKDPVMLHSWLDDAVRVSLPSGYAIKGGISWFLFGKGFRLVFVLPQGEDLATAMRCVEKPDGSGKGKKKVVLLLGTKTAFLVCKLFKEKQENVDDFVEGLIRKGDQNKDPKVLTRELLEVDVGGRKAKAAMQVFVREGRTVRSVIVGLKPNVVLAGYGPDKSFDEAAFLAICRSVKP